METVTRKSVAQEPDLLFNQSLEKGLAVLCAFNEQRRTMTLADVAEAVDITKSSAQRMIHTLEQLGYVRRHPQTKRYQLTPRVMRIGLNYLAANGLIELATPFLSQLSRQTNETCNLTEPDGTELVYVSRFVTAKFVPIHMPVGSRIPMYSSSAGRAYLSNLPPEETRALLMQSNRVARTMHTITDVDEIMQMMEMIRRKGYATSSEETFLGDMAIGAAIVGSDGYPLGAIHIVAPTSRWTMADAEQQLAPSLIECARSISRAARTLS